MGRTACTEPQCLYKGALYLYLRVELYLYSPCGPYSLYRASVPLQGCTLPLPKSRAIPLLLLLWAVWPVQSLSACRRVHLIKADIQLHSILHLSTKESVEIIMLQLLYCQKRTPLYPLKRRLGGVTTAGRGFGNQKESLVPT